MQGAWYAKTPTAVTCDCEDFHSIVEGWQGTSFGCWYAHILALLVTLTEYLETNAICKRKVITKLGY